MKAIDTDSPYGIEQLVKNSQITSSRPTRVRCFVRGCTQELRVPTRSFAGDVCPEHGIRCHDSSSGTTYSYVDVRRNCIVDPEMLANRVVGHPFKYESNRFGYEKSEDALTWNVFRSFQIMGKLHRIAHAILDREIETEPFLFLWGLSITDDSLVPWDLLKAARERFESKLPVERPYTEPDIALLSPGNYLILIEAKFTSPNPTYEDGERKDPQALTKEELLRIYAAAELKTLDPIRAQGAERVHYQLWRNLIFAEWMGLRASTPTPGYVTNLTRATEGGRDCAEFSRMLNPQYARRATWLSWEEIYDLADAHELRSVQHYLRNKTAGLVPAFRFPVTETKVATE